MKKDINQEFIDDILELAKSTNKELCGKINAFVDIYDDQKKINANLTREHDFFFKKWDQRHTLEHKKKDKIIEQQSRLAAMGEMIDAVAHQWKQPLNAISMMIEILRDDFKSGDVNEAYINDLDETVHIQIDHMVNTLNEFRNFLRPSTQNEKFHINTVLQNVQVLMKDELLAQNLYIKLDIDEEIKIFGNKNQFKHLFINLINNSIDAFNENDITSREISIKCYKKITKIIIEIEDNAGGIPRNLINHIFEANVTTKPESKGSGIGLYMSNQIIKKNNGTIKVQNTDTGALFTINLRESTI